MTESLFSVLDSQHGEIESDLSYAAAVAVLNEECERYADEGWTIEKGWASEGNYAAARLFTRDGGHDYERFLSVERDDA